MLGVVGELKPEVRKHFKLPDYTAAFTLDIDALETAANKSVSSYRPLSKYPSVTQDLSLKVDADVHFGALFETVREVLSAISDELSVQFAPLSIYRGDDAAHKSVTFRFTAASSVGTLTDADMSRLIGTVTKAAAKTHKAVQV